MQHHTTTGSPRLRPARLALAALAAVCLALTACGKAPKDSCEQVVDKMMAQKQAENGSDVPEKMKKQLEAMVREEKVKAIRECKENKDDLWTEEIRACRMKADNLAASDACAAQARTEAAKDRTEPEDTDSK